MGTGVFAIGLDFKDSDELDQLSSKPLYQYRTLVYDEGEMGELGLTIKTTIENGETIHTYTTQTICLLGYQISQDGFSCPFMRHLSVKCAFFNF